MPFPTNYGLYMDPALPGQMADSGFTDKVSRRNEDRANDGCLMSLGASSESCKQPAAATDVTNLQRVSGVVIRTQARMSAYPDDSLPAGYIPGECPSIMRKGRIWVPVEDAVTVGTSTVNVRYAGTGLKGAFRGAAVASETAQLPDGQAKWIVGTTGAGLAQLEINL